MNLNLPQTRQTWVAICAFFALAGSQASPACAGLISIGSSSLSANGSQILSDQTLVSAWNTNGNAAGTPTVNGITFTNTQPANITISAAFTAFVVDNAATGGHYSGDMPEIMSDFAGTTGATNGLVTLTGLTVGQWYRAQFLHHQDVNSNGIREFRVRYGSLGTDPSTSVMAVGDNVGFISQIVFTADATSQSFLFQVNNADDRAILNGVVLHTIPPAPEPTTLLLAALGGITIWIKRRPNRTAILSDDASR